MSQFKYFIGLADIVHSFFGSTIFFSDILQSRNRMFILSVDLYMFTNEYFRLMSNLSYFCL